MRGDILTWRDAAACAGLRPGLFHAQTGRQAQAAKACCATCPVKEPCLLTALVAEEDAGYRFGIWGATTPGERAVIRGRLSGPGARGLLVACLDMAEERFRRSLPMDLEAA
ncbi:MAG: WhiB family transcriptional regulator [Acidimicrobiales bacterium]